MGLEELAATALALAKLKRGFLDSQLNESAERMPDLDEDNELDDEEDAESITSDKSLSQKGRENEVVGSDDLNEGDIARHVMKRVTDRLRGEGQKSISDELDELIHKATDKQRLAQMYEGWMAWI
jgi:hypothetical protein